MIESRKTDSANEIMAATLRYIDKEREFKRKRMEAEAKAQKERDEAQRKAAEAWVAKRMAERKPGEPLAPDYVPLPGSQLNIFGYPTDNVKRAMGMAPTLGNEADSVERFLESAKGQCPMDADRCFGVMFGLSITPELMQKDLRYVPYNDIPFDLSDDEEDEDEKEE